MSGNYKQTAMNKAFYGFLVIWAGEFLSGIGSGLTAFALAAYAFRQTGLASSAAMIYLCTFLPAFLLRPAGGVLADRMDRRLLMIAGNLGSGLGIAIILLLMNVNKDALWLIYPGAVLSSVFTAVHSPSYKASVSDFLPKELYEKASGMLQLSGTAPLLAAPFIAGLLMSFFDIYLILIIDILTFLISALIIIFIRRKMDIKVKAVKVKTGFASEMLDGFKTLNENRGVFLLTLIVSMILFNIGLLQALLGPMVLSFTDTASLGTAQSVCASGMVISSLIIGGRRDSAGEKRYVTVLSVSLALMGLFFSFIGIRGNIWMIIIPGFLFFSTLPFVNSSIEVLIRGNISNEKQGRAWAMISFITYFGSIIAFASAGFLSDRIFNPLLMNGGLFESSLGRIFGTGAGRGIALIFFISGIIVIYLSTIIYRSKTIQSLELSGNTVPVTRKRNNTISVKEAG